MRFRAEHYRFLAYSLDSQLGTAWIKGPSYSLIQIFFFSSNQSFFRHLPKHWMPSRATWVAFSAQYRITPAQSCKRKQPPAQEKMLLHKAVVLFQVLQYFLMQWNNCFLSVIAESNKGFLTIALKCPLSQARATLYRYCRQELSLVYMSAILPCINYTAT